MPGVNPPAGDAFFARLRNIEKALAALQNQQLFLVADLEQNMRVRLGPLVDGTGTPNGDFGLSVSDSNGHTTNILPVYTSSVGAVESTTSTSYTDLATPGPSVTAEVGSTGDVEIICNSYIGIPGTSSGQSAGFVGISIDGAPPTSPLDEAIYFSNTGGGTPQGMAANQSFTTILTGLAPLSSVTFTMLYKVAGPPTVSFGSRYLSVRPI